jgi:hypothetical protein
MVDTTQRMGIGRRIHTEFKGKEKQRIPVKLIRFTGILERKKYII